MRLVRSVGVAVVAALLTACAGNPLQAIPASIGAQAQRSAARTMSSNPQFVGFWESWSDTNMREAFNRLGSVPAQVSTVDVAFSIANSNAIADPQNTFALLPGARSIHARNGKVLLSLGGATSNFNITDPQAFVKNLQAYLRAHPGIYDGFDFDDEVIQTRKNGRQQLIAVLKATRTAFPHAVISFDADSSGADPRIDLPNYIGEDRLILKDAGSAIDYVNVMDYDQFGWKPSNDPNCSYSPGSQHDCYLDIMMQFAGVPVEGGTLAKSKIVMGLMIGQADDKAFLKPQDTAGYAAWVKANGFHGLMIWDLDLDNPQKPLNGTGYPKGTYVKAIGKALDS